MAVMNLIQHRNKRTGEYTYYEVPQGTLNAIQCLQGEHSGKLFITLAELQVRKDIQPNNNGNYLLTHLQPRVFNELVEVIPVFSLEQHKIEVEAATDKYVDTVLNEYWYRNEGELSIRSKFDNQYLAEATALSLWHIATYDALEVYFENVTEQNALSVEQFLAILPNPVNYVQTESKKERKSD
jgi:hypothetical protein